MSRPAIRQLRLRDLVAVAAAAIFVMMSPWLRRLLTLTLVAEVAALRRAAAFDRPRGLVGAATFLVMPLPRRSCLLAPVLVAVVAVRRHAAEVGFPVSVQMTVRGSVRVAVVRVALAPLVVDLGAAPRARRSSTVSAGPVPAAALSRPLGRSCDSQNRHWE